MLISKKIKKAFILKDRAAQIHGPYIPRLPLAASVEEGFLCQCINKKYSHLFLMNIASHLTAVWREQKIKIQ